MKISLSVLVMAACAFSATSSSDLDGFSLAGWKDAWESGDPNDVIKFFSENATVFDKDGETQGKEKIEAMLIDDYDASVKIEGGYVLVAPFAPTSYIWPTDDSDADNTFKTPAEKFDNFQAGCWNYGFATEWTYTEADGTEGRGVSIIDLDENNMIKTQLVIKDVLDEEGVDDDEEEYAQEITKSVGLREIMKVASIILEKVPDFETWKKISADGASVKIWNNGKYSSCAGSECAEFWKKHFSKDMTPKHTFFTPTTNGFVTSWVDAAPKDDGKLDQKEKKREKMMGGRGMMEHEDSLSEEMNFGIAIFELDKDGAIDRVRNYIEKGNFSIGEGDTQRLGFPACLHA